MSYTPYNPEIESHFLAVLIQYPTIFGDVSLASEKDFSAVHRPIYSVIRQQLEAMPPAPVSTVILADKLKTYGVAAAKLGGVEPYDYIWALSVKPIKQDDGVSLLKELKLLTVRRELVEKCQQAERALRDTPAERFEEMVSIVDKTLSSITTEYYTTNDTLNLFTGMEAKIEEEGNTPLTDEQAGFLGPFPSINETIGSMTYRGALVVIGARTETGKSSLSWFYNTHVAEKHKLISLTLDAAEMTPEELQYRQVCALSNGKIPYWALQNRQWRKNEEWVKMIRSDIWPRIQQMERTGVYYKNIGTMTPKDIITYIKRFYYNKVGRGNFLLINFDYLKGMESMNRQQSEHQAIGNFVNDLKCLITEEINASIWTSVQNNRTGIPTKENQHDAAHSGQMGLSDRIIQQATHGFILQFKTPAEIALEANKFGNLRLTCVKKRRLLGRRFEDMLIPVKTPHGYTTNYFNLETRGFSYLDKGSLKDMISKIGQGVIEVNAAGDKSITI